jgi:long-chain acyl-CoA synthetase
METTINQVFKNRVEKYGDRLAVEKRRGDKWETATWNEYYQRARNVGLGLHALGIQKGERVAILSDNRLEWVYTDMGALGVGVCVVALYATIPASEVEYILKDAGAKAVVVENKTQLDKALVAQKNCPTLEKIIVIESAGCDLDGKNVRAFADVMNAGQNKHQEDAALFQRLADSVTPEDLLTLQYTSGTTGMPKGSILTHGVVMAQLRALDAVEPKYGNETDNVVGFLPLSHIFERVPVHFYVMYRGITKSYAGSMETLVEDIATKKPTIMFGVPRIHEKIYHKMLAGIKEKSHVVQSLFAWAQGVGNEVSKYKQDKQPIPAGLNFKYKIAYALVFKKLQHALGGRIRWFCAAGAPIAKEIVSFFQAAGIFVLEGYGLSEVAGGATLSHLEDFYPGSVGHPLPGIDIKLADDGEILIKSESLFKGYWGNEEETRQHFTDDGYFKTGDVGMFNKQGLLFITDRKKDLLITSGGKNIAPQKTETIFKENPIFSQFVVVGDARKYLTALINVDLDIAKAVAEEKGIKFHQPEDLLDDPAFKSLLDEILAENNKRLSSVETIKYYRILKTPLSAATGELSVKLSVKRDVVQKKYADVINSMYKD